MLSSGVFTHTEAEGRSMDNSASRRQPSPVESSAGPRVLYTVTEVASLLGLGRSKTYELVMSGIIDSVTIGRSRRISAAELARFVNELRQGGAA